MPLNSYDGLFDAILAWCNRRDTDTDFVLQIPTFITLAEQQIFLDVPTLGTQEYVTGNFTIGNSTYPKPALWGKTLTLSYTDFGNTVHVIERISYEYGLQYNQNLRIGPPMYYTDYSYNYIQMFPAPDKAYPFQLAYYSKVTPLTVNNQTNWITQNAPDLLFYLSMSKAQMYLKNFQDSQIWEDKYKDRAKVLNDYDLSRLLDRTADITTKTIPSPSSSGV